MAQDYDKILKENMEALILPLADKLLGLSLGSTEELPDDLQTTLERKPDLLKRVTEPPAAAGVPATGSPSVGVPTTANKGNGSYILHIEFQTKDEPTMANRMLLYYAMLWEKYQEPVKQFVVFIGQRKPRMATALSHDPLQYHFSLIDIRELNYHNLLSSATQPEEAVLAILSGFKKSEVDTVIPEILTKLRQLSGVGGIPDERKLRRYVRQIEILANLRNLQPQVIRYTEAMALTYDIKSDVRYQQGREEVITALLKSGLLTDEQIARTTSTSLDQIQQIKTSMTNK
jgi:hypothetical protein